MSNDPESLVLHLLREMRSEMATKADLARLESNIADVRSDMHSLRADVASDLISLEKRLGEQIVGLRRAVVEYHSSAVGHGVLFSEIEDRVRRIEERLGMSPSGAH